MLTGYLVGYRATVAALTSRIRELESREYPTALSRSLLQTLYGAIIESDKIVDGLASLQNSDVESIIMRHGQLLSLIHQLVHLVSTSIGDDVPRWAIQPMKFEIQKYLKDSVDIIMVGGNEGGNFAYDYRLDNLRSILSRALGEDTADHLTKNLPKHMAVFHFPFGERDNVFAHGAFFHEVGHQIDVGITGISNRITQDYLTLKDSSIRTETLNILKPILTQIGIKPQAPQTRQKTFEDEQAELLLEDTVKSIQRVLYNWAREFCADLLATRILGPAYAIIVVTSPALLHNLTTNSLTHPSTMLRLSLVLNLLSNNKAGNFFSTCGEALEQAGVNTLLENWKARCSSAEYLKMKWHQSVSKHSVSGIDQYTVRLAIELAHNILAAIVDETDDLGYYSPKQFERDIEQVSPILRQWTTINERIDFESRTHTPNEISTIYNVGIAQYLQEQTNESRDRLSNLIRKSIELSQIQRLLLEH